MFIKAFKVKSNVQLKGSESKKLKNRILAEFPNLTQDDLQNLIPNKSTMTIVKITTYGNVACNVYAVDKKPMLFEDESNLLVPTVYALWIVPTMIPFLTTHPDVLPRLANGADLMLPGVIRRSGGLEAYGRMKKDQLVAVNLSSNSACIAVGRLARSSYDLYMAANSGPCVKILHVFSDKLWGLEPTVTMQIPSLSAVLTAPNLDDFPELGGKQKKDDFPPVSGGTKNNEVSSFASETQLSQVVSDIPKIENLEINDSIKDDQLNKNDEIPEDAVTSKETCTDEILRSAFLTALKMDGKKLALPLLTSNFYRLHVLPNANVPIDLKKTSYKKLSKFLDDMSDQGFVVVREETKGVEKIISVDFEHPVLLDFIPNSNVGVSEKEKEGKDLFHTRMTELYLVTDETVPLFTRMGFRKGDGIECANLKKLLKDYVSKKQIPYVKDSKILSLDVALANVVGKPEASFDEAYSTILSKMHHTYEMKASNDVKGSNKPNIQMSLATKSGNKKVTLVNNLEAYGIILSEFAKACKLGAAASTTIIKSDNQKHDILQIQGNQVKLIHEILTETYKIPPKNISGLDLARKEKKKKK